MLAEKRLSVVLGGICKRILCRRGIHLVFEFVISGRIRMLAETFRDKCISAKNKHGDKPVLILRFFD